MIELTIIDGTQPFAQQLQTNAAIAAAIERLKAEQEEDDESEASADMEEANEDDREKSPRCDVDME